MKVLNFGSLNIDYVYGVEHFVRKGETISSDFLHVFCGGKGLNQSIALAKANAKVHHAGVIGEDGIFLLDALKEAGVETEQILVQKDVRTGNAIIQNDRAGDNCILLFGGANQSVKRKYVDQVLEKFEKGDYIVLQNEINEMKYLLERAHEKGMVIVLNPSPMNDKIKALSLEYVDYFLLNELEAIQLAGVKSGREEDLLNELEKKFPRASIVLTLGEKGSIFRSKGQLYRQAAFPVKAIDTTAAGDTFTGYFVAGLMQGMAITQIMKTAAAASAIAVTRSGAAPSIPCRHDVEEWLKIRM